MCINIHSIIVLTYDQLLLYNYYFNDLTIEKQSLFQKVVIFPNVFNLEI